MTIYDMNSIKNTILCGDSLTEMKKMPDKSIDLCITSPPYNLRNSTGGWSKDHTHKGSKWNNAVIKQGYDDGLYDDNMPYDQYIQWQRDCITEMMRLLTDDGAIFYNHKWRVQGGLIQDRHEILQGFPVRQIIIWQRKGGINFNQGYFLPTYEVIYLIAKKGFKLAKNANKCGDVWQFNQEMHNPHPAPYPVALIDRIVSSTTAHTILDPFMGSGTTAISCLHYNRDYIGIELSQNYCDIAEKRIEQEKCSLFNQ